MLTSFEDPAATEVMTFPVAFGISNATVKSWI
jgi:hypothetical protein